MIRAIMASISAAWSAEKNSNLSAAADRAALCACCAAASAAGQCTATHVAERLLTLWTRNLLRECTRKRSSELGPSRYDRLSEPSTQSSTHVSTNMAHKNR